MGETRWYEHTEDEGGKALDTMAGAVKQICDALMDEQEPRRMRYLESVARYEGLALGDTSPSAMNSAVSNDDSYNLTRSVVDAVEADIAARQRPKPDFLTSAADWKTRRRCKKLNEFLEAQMHENQGIYEDVWEVLRDCFKDCEMGGFGAGFAKVWADDFRERVAVERVLPFEILVDPEESKYRDPQNLFHSFSVARELLRDQYEQTENDDDERRMILAAIDTAASDDKITTRVSQRVTDMVRVYEAWRLPFGTRDGAHCVCISGKVLLYEPWTRPRFPFVMFFWARERVGFWGRGLADEIEASHNIVNDASRRLLERMRKCSNSYLFLPVGSRGDKDKLSSNEDMEIIEYTGPQPPVLQPAVPAASQEFQSLEDNIRRAYEMCGVSQMNAQSRKDSGVTAAVAMRTLNDIQTVRFLPKARMYEQGYASYGELAIDAVKDLGGIVTKWPGKKFLKTIKWSDVKMAEDMYSVRVVPASQLSRDLGTRYQLAQELLDAQIITPDDFKSLLGMPDLDAVLERDTAERDYIEMICDRYLDAEDDEELEELGGYDTPDPAIGDKMGALAIVKNTYFEARVDGAPEYSLALIRRYMRELAKLAAPPAPAPAPPGMDAGGAAGPMPPGMPGPPPMPPGGPPPPGMPPGAPLQ